MREALKHFEGLDPIVIFSLLAEDDLDRMLLDFRDWPKPRLELEDGELVVREPELLDTAAYLEEHPPRAVSWLWRYLVYGTEVLPTSLRARLTDQDGRRERKQELARGLFRELVAELEGRDLDWFVALFQGEDATRSNEPYDWEEAFLIELFRELRIPYVITRADLRALAEERGLELSELYLQDGVGVGHWNETGNEAAFRTLRRGLRGEFDPYELVPAR